MTQFTIASTRCRIEAQAGDFVFAPNLTPFADASAWTAPDLLLSVSSGEPTPRAPAGPPTEVLVRDDGLEFVRPQGSMLATGDFSRCSVRLHPAPSEPFTGQPWLMLALWGRVTHRDGLLLHGACCELEGKFILLLGERQAGKSTLARLVAPAGGTCLTDEYPFVTCTAGGPVAHGSPWPGLAGQPSTLSAPLAAIFYLSHAPANVLTLLPPKQAAQRLITNNRFFTWSPATLPIAFELIEQVSAATPLFDFGFVPGLPAVDEMRRVL
ncbi:hypothetical protein LLH23_22095 [bacterium]|nr:hypothetical protein [bacterium]